MSKTPEGKLVNQVNKYLKDNGWFQVNLISTSVSGIPDRLILKDGRYIWLELKAEGGRVSPIQTYIIDKLKKQGAEVYVIYTLAQLKEIL